MEGKHRPWKIEEGDIKIHREHKLGQGSYGAVYRASWREMPVAAKQLHDIFFDGQANKHQVQEFTDKFKKEWELLSRLKHPNILTMFGVMIPTRPGQSPVMVTELLDCSLSVFYQRSTSSSKLTLKMILSIMLDVAQGLRYLHQRKNPIVHRDLASKNIVLTPTRKAKIADLGIARIFDDYLQQYATPGPGTLPYQAPETLILDDSQRAKYNPKVDVFSYGVVLMEVVLGKNPQPTSFRDKEQHIVPEVHRRAAELEEMEDHAFKRIVLYCLRDEPTQRPTAEQLVHELEKQDQEISAEEQEKQVERKQRPKKFDYEFKVVLVGASGVGKTCLIVQYNDRYFTADTPSTLGVDVKHIVVELDNKIVLLKVYDTAGQERFGSLTRSFYREASAAILVYDITWQTTFDRLNYYRREVEQNVQEPVVFFLVGNKVDMEDRREVPEDTAMTFAGQHDMPWLETSAKTDENVDQVFMVLACLLKDRADQHILSCSTQVAPQPFSEVSPSGIHLTISPITSGQRRTSVIQVVDCTEEIKRDNFCLRHWKWLIQKFKKEKLD